jgi:hypothetical protein
MSIRNKTFAREPAKTKAELREMLSEAIRNTRPELLAAAIRTREKDRG